MRRSDIPAEDRGDVYRLIFFAWADGGMNWDNETGMRRYAREMGWQWRRFTRALTHYKRLCDPSGSLRLPVFLLRNLKQNLPEIAQESESNLPTSLTGNGGCFTGVLPEFAPSLVQVSPEFDTQNAPKSFNHGALSDSQKSEVRSQKSEVGEETATTTTTAENSQAEDEAKSEEKAKDQTPAPPIRPAAEIYAMVAAERDQEFKGLAIREMEIIKADVPDAESGEFENWLRGYSASYGIKGVAKTVKIYVEQRDKTRRKEQEQRKGRLPGEPIVYQVPAPKVASPNAPLQPAVAGGNGGGGIKPLGEPAATNPARRTPPVFPFRALIETAKQQREAAERGRGASSVWEVESGADLECPF